ncbi:MAG: hypothetical protein GMKNLPBB_03155 [Myxococcota bacterium]|nr:hypothetical protein [Myxococcota bacterium]
MLCIRALLVVLGGIFLFSACSETGVNAAPDAGAPAIADAGVSTGGCVPDKAAWDTSVKAMVARNCSTCHGETPDYGAPYGLTDHSRIIAGEPGLRPVDKMIAALNSGRMPPVNFPRVPKAELDAIVKWASCGAAAGADPQGLQADRPVYAAPSKPTMDLPKIDMLADQFVVSETVKDLYMCFPFRTPVDSDRFIRRIEKVLDQSRVVHHAVLFKPRGNNVATAPFECTGQPRDTDYYYAWAPGGGAIEFPDGGLRVRPGEPFYVQIHYNNGAGVAARDSSGIRIYHGPPEGTEYGMLASGPLAFLIPQGDRVPVRNTCLFRKPMRVLAGMPHMHEIGQDFEQFLRRADGRRENVITLRNWSFEAQNFYSMPMEFQPGDVLDTTCFFNNNRGQVVSAGPRTRDEMCFNFMYVTPPPETNYCDDQDMEEFPFTPGVCPVKDGRANPRFVSGALVEGAPPPLAGGELPEGLWELASVSIWAKSMSTPLGDVDPAKSMMRARGQMRIEAGRITTDINSKTNLMLKNGAGRAIDSNISWSGPRPAGAPANPLTITPDCGDKTPQTLFHDLKDGVLMLGIPQKIGVFEYEIRASFTVVK